MGLQGQEGGEAGLGSHRHSWECLLAAKERMRLLWGQVCGYFPGTPVLSWREGG